MQTLNISLETWKIVAFLMAGFGTFQCVRGHRFLQLTLAGWGFSAGFVLGAELLASSSGEELGPLNVINLFIGLAAVVLIIWLNDKAGWIIGVLFGLYCGYLICSIVFNFSLESEATSSATLPESPISIGTNVVIMGFVALVSLIAGWSLLKPTLVFCTAVVGAWTFVTASFKLLFAESNIIHPLINPAAAVQEYGLALIVCWVLACMFGLACQYRGTSDAKELRQA